jgi:hypothetical protein
MVPFFASCANPHFRSGSLRMDTSGIPGVFATASSMFLSGTESLDSFLTLSDSVSYYAAISTPKRRIL